MTCEEFGSVPTVEVAHALDEISNEFPQSVHLAYLNAAIQVRMARTRLCGSPVGDPVPDHYDAWRTALNTEIADVLNKMAETARAMGEERTAIFIEGHASIYQSEVHQ